MSLYGHREGGRGWETPREGNNRKQAAMRANAKPRLASVFLFLFPVRWICFEDIRLLRSFFIFFLSILRPSFTLCCTSCCPSLHLFLPELKHRPSECVSEWVSGSFASVASRSYVVVLGDAWSKGVVLPVWSHTPHTCYGRFCDVA